MARHRYVCPVCRTESPPYPLRAMANSHGVGHRRERHGGEHEHPIGEEIVVEPGTRWSDVPRGQRIATVLLLIGIAIMIFTR